MEHSERGCNRLSKREGGQRTSSMSPPQTERRGGGAEKAGWREREQEQREERLWSGLRGILKQVNVGNHVRIQVSRARAQPGKVWEFNSLIERAFNYT